MRHFLKRNAQGPSHPPYTPILVHDKQKLTPGELGRCTAAHFFHQRFNQLILAFVGFPFLDGDFTRSAQGFQFGNGFRTQGFRQQVGVPLTIEEVFGEAAGGAVGTGHG